jgi:plasmid stabilization system protein ParE
MKGYEFLPEAEEEMNEAARFYERRKEGLGLEFLNEVQRTITSILAHPQSGPALSQSIRRRIVRRFPFGVLYAIDDEKRKKDRMT